MEHALFISARRERTCLRASVIREVRIRGRVTPRSAPGIAASGRIAGPTDGDSAAAHKHRPRLKSTLAEIRNRLTKHPPLQSRPTAWTSALALERDDPVPPRGRLVVVLDDVAEDEILAQVLGRDEVESLIGDRPIATQEGVERRLVVGQVLVAENRVLRGRRE